MLLIQKNLFHLKIWFRIQKRITAIAVMCAEEMENIVLQNSGNKKFISFFLFFANWDEIWYYYQMYFSNKEAV